MSCFATGLHSLCPFGLLHVINSDFAIFTLIIDHLIIQQKTLALSHFTQINIFVSYIVLYVLPDFRIVL